MSNTVNVSAFKKASDIAHKLGYFLRVSGPDADLDSNDNDKWVIDLVNEDGPADDLDNISGVDEDFETALNKFIEKAEDEIESDPSSFEDEEDED